MDPVLRRKFKKGGKTYWKEWSGSGLDTKYPYRIGTQPPPLDSPGVRLDPPLEPDEHLEATAKETGTMWMLFKPTAVGKDTRPVPLRKVTWDWSGTAVTRLKRVCVRRTLTVRPHLLVEIGKAVLLDRVELYALARHWESIGLSSQPTPMR